MISNVIIDTIDIPFCKAVYSALQNCVLWGLNC